MIPLIWKEWQESKRPFAGGLIVLIGLPLFMVIISRLFLHDEWLFGAGTFLLIPLAPIIAAVWGAHVVCKDFTTAQGHFLFAQPIPSAQVMISKIVVAVPLLLALVLVAHLVDVSGYWVVNYPKSFFADEIAIPLPFYSSFLLGLVATMAASFLAAAVFKQLVPAILMGLVAAVILLAGPHIWLSAFGYTFVEMDEFERAVGIPWPHLLGSLVAGVAAVGLCMASVVAARRPERPPVSLRPLAWGGAGVFLSCTAVVTGTIGNNTVVTYELQAARSYAWYDRPIGEVWSRENTVYWLAFVGSIQDPVVSHYDVQVATFDDEGHLSQEPRTAGTFPGHDVHFVKLSRDGQTVELVRGSTTSPNEKTWELASVDLTGEVDAEAQVLYRSRTRPYEWVYANERLIRLTAYWTAEAEEYERYVEIISPRGESAGTLGKVDITGWTGWGGWMPVVLDLEGDTLTISYRNLYSGRLGRVIRVDVSDPTNPTIILETQPYPTPSTALSRLAAYFDDWSAAFHEGKLALSSIGGLWIYELTPEGGWKLLGVRRASFVEPLAGRFNSRLMWKGDRVYEYSFGFGLMVYDVSDPTKPRRIAHAGIPIRQIAPLDNGLVAILTESHALEIHRLPGE